MAISLELVFLFLFEMLTTDACPTCVSCIFFKKMIAGEGDQGPDRHLLRREKATKTLSPSPVIGKGDQIGRHLQSQEKVTKKRRRMRPIWLPYPVTNFFLNNYQYDQFIYVIPLATGATGHDVYHEHKWNLCMWLTFEKKINKRPACVSNFK